MSDIDQDEARKKTEREKAIREQMEARGYDPDDPSDRAKYEELRARVDAKRIDEKDLGREMYKHHWEQEQRKLRDGPQQIPKDPEAKRHAYSKELEEEVKAGRIDEREKVDREGRFEKQLAMEVRLPGERTAPEIPAPRQEPPQQRPLEIDNRPQEHHDQSVKKTMDWERMLTDPAYRKEMEQQAREERALRLQQMEQERGTGQQRTGSGGRER